MERGVVLSVFRASLPNLHVIAIGDGLGVGDDPWTDWGVDPQYPQFRYQINVGDYAFMDLSTKTSTPYGTLSDLLVHEMTHVWQYAHGRQVKASSLWAHTPFSDYDFKAGEAWIDYNVEQQASIVEKWYHDGMRPDHELFPYVAGVIWQHGDEKVIRMTLAELKTYTSGSPGPWPVEDPSPLRPNFKISVQSVDAVLVPLLSKRFAAGDVAGYGGRVRQIEALFRGLDQMQAATLYPRLVARKNGDPVSMSFYDILSTPTRTSLLKLLRDMMGSLV